MNETDKSESLETAKQTQTEPTKPEHQTEKGDEIKQLSKHGFAVLRQLLKEPKELWCQTVDLIFTWKTAYIIGGIIVSWYATASWFEHKISTLNKEHLQSTSTLEGRLQQKSDDYAQLEHDLQNEREAKRSKEQENQKLITQLAFFQSVPDKTISLYSNLVQFAESEPTNRINIAMLSHSVSNFLTSAEKAIPTFALFANDTAIHHKEVVRVGKDRQLTLKLRNQSDISAEEVNIVFISQTPQTNWSVDRWQFMTQTELMGDGGVVTTHSNDVTHCRYALSTLLPPELYMPLLPFTLSTNCTDKVLQNEVDVYSKGSKMHRFFFLTLIEPNL